MIRAFSVSLMQKQEMTSGVLTEIRPPFFKNFDEGSCMRNGQFQAPETGIYHFDISLSIWFGTEEPNAVFIQVYKNNINVVRSEIQFVRSHNTGWAPNLNMSLNVKLVAGDEITLRVMHIGSPDTFLREHSTTFSGFKIN